MCAVQFEILIFPKIVFSCTITITLSKNFSNIKIRILAYIGALAQLPAGYWGADYILYYGINGLTIYLQYTYRFIDIILSEIDISLLLNSSVH